MKQTDTVESFVFLTTENYLFLPDSGSDFDGRLPRASAQVLNGPGGGFQRGGVGTFGEQEKIRFHRVRMPQQFLALRRASVSAHACESNAEKRKENAHMIS